VGYTATIFVTGCGVGMGKSEGAARPSRASIVPEWELERQELYLVLIEDFVTRFAESKFPQRVKEPPFTRQATTACLGRPAMHRENDDRLEEASRQSD
jgi:hypothetical protein